MREPPVTGLRVVAAEHLGATASQDNPELGRLVAAMEAGQLPLEKLLEHYQRGADLLAFCRSRLDAVEQQVKVLEQGQLKPWTQA